MIRGRDLVVASAILGLSACGERPGPSEPASQFLVADSLRDNGRYREAAVRYSGLRDSFALVADSANLWRAQLWWSDMQRRLGRPDSARAGLAQARRLATDDPNRIGWTRLLFTFLLERAGQLDSAFAEATAALELARATRDPQLEAYAYNALGTAHSLQGRYREALTADSTSLALRRALGVSPRSIAQSLNEVGIGYRHLGRYTDAMRVYEEALILYRRLGDEVGIAMVSYNLANIHIATGDMEKAIELLHQSLRSSERLEHAQGMGLNHNALATLYVRSGNRAAARKHVEDGLRINRTKGLKYGEILALETLGRIELAGRRPAQAVVALRTALTLADSARFGLERVSVRAVLSAAELARGRAGEALRLARAARTIADSLGDPAAQFQSLEAEATALEALRRGAALDVYIRAIELLESWRGRLALGDLRMGVAEPRLRVYEGAISLLVKQRRAAEAFGVAERARARLLLELMADRDGRTAHSREQKLRARLRERYEARTQVNDSATRARLDREILEIGGELTRLAESGRALESKANVPDPGPYDAAQLQKTLLGDPGLALLAYFWGDSVVYGWWITRDSARGVPLGPADSLAHLVDFLRTTVEIPAQDSMWRAVARRAYRRLVEPLAPGPFEKLLVVADGPLAHVPLEALIPADDAPPWGATHQIGYGPSGSVLAGLAHARRSGRWDRTMLAVGNPTSAGGALLGGSRARGDTLEPPAPLPYAEREARELGILFRRVGADLLIGRRATLARWLQLDPARYRYLHFAAHAAVSDRRPERTHLVLADGSLDLAAIRRLRLTAQLVTLSACRTALGRRVRGEGIIGLPHAFLAAGASGAVVTLWRIRDRSAADFMRDFYRELHAGRPAADALLAVRRRWVAAGGPTAQPAHWAPFVLVGGISE